MNGSLRSHNLSEKRTSYSDGGQLPSRYNKEHWRPARASSRSNGVGALHKRLFYLYINTRHIYNIIPIY